MLAASKTTHSDLGICAFSCCTFALIFVLTLSSKNMPQAAVQTAASKSVLLYDLAALKFMQPLAVLKKVQPLAVVRTTESASPSPSQAQTRKCLQLSSSSSLNLLMKE